jgi:thiol:disulfide interchange protein
MNKFVSVFLLLLTIVVANFSLVDNTANAQQSIFDTSSSVLFDNDNDFLTVDEAFSFDFHQKNDQLEITFHIADGYYLYREVKTMKMNFLGFKKFTLASYSSLSTLAKPVKISRLKFVIKVALKRDYAIHPPVRLSR